MSKKLAINGFGRIGRVVFRIIAERRKAGNFDAHIAAINDLTDLKTLAHLLKYDSIHGRYPGTIEIDGDALIVDGERVAVSAERDPSKLPWKSNEIDVTLEATGIFADSEKAKAHLQAGARKVLISAPAKGSPDATICYGVNSNLLTPEMTVVSTASCTTNCIAPVAKVINDKFGIEKGSVTTIHSYTNDQRILDLPHSDLRRARAAALSMIPTTTGAAKAISLVLPELEGKLDGMAIRVPTPNVSLIDMVLLVSKNTTSEEVNAELRAAAEGVFQGVMGFCTDPIVSIDVMQTNESSIVDALSTKVTGGNLVKVLSWYDNEWGFANRAVDLLGALAK